jgi:HEAT repeat protein
MVLREFGTVHTLFHFKQSLTDDSSNVRLEAVRGLGRLENAEAIDPLIEVAEGDKDPYIRFEAMRNLRQVGVGYPRVLDLAFRALKDPDRNVRSQAAGLLGNFHDDRSIQPLVRATADIHWSVRESAEIALHNFGDRVIPHMIEALESPRWTTRFRAARLLGEMGEADCIVHLEKLLKKKRENKEVREIAEKAIVQLKTKASAGT